MAQLMHNNSSVVSSDSMDVFCQAAALSSKSIDCSKLRQHFSYYIQGLEMDEEECHKDFLKLKTAIEARRAATSDLLDDAAREGNLAALQWLRALCQTHDLEHNLLEAAADAGELDILKYLTNTREPEDYWGSKATVAAIPHDECFKWLILESKRGDAKLHADILPALISAEDIETLDWLKESGRGCLWNSFDENVMKAVVKSADLQMLQWFRPMITFALFDKCTQLVAKRGDIAMMKWLAADDTPSHWGWQTLACAVASGSLPLVQFLRSERCSWGPEVCRHAATSRRREILEWLRGQNPPCPWDTKCAQQAAKFGDLDLIQWIRTQDPPAPWDEACTDAAAENGQLEILKYACSQDPPCPLSRNVMRVAINGTGDLQVLDWLHERGCTLQGSLYWDALTKPEPAKKVRWLHQHNNPLPGQWEAVSISGNVPILMFFGDIGVHLWYEDTASLETARRTFCTFHGLLRWCLRAVADPSRNAARAFDYLAPNSDGQVLLTRLALLPSELITKIALMARLQHDLLG